MLRGLGRRPFLSLAPLPLLAMACEPRRSEPSPAASADRETKTGPTPIVVEVTTDLVCPWCYLGTERLDRAIAASGHAARVEVRHQPFLLSPETPDEGTDVTAYLRAKTGREPKEMFARVEAVARESGLPLDLSKQPKLYPTVRGHALLQRAQSPQQQRALERALFRAYFVDGTDLTSRAALVAIATAHGFDEQTAKRIVDDPAELTAVREAARGAAQRGVTGVPLFAFPGGKKLSGAQSEGALRAAIVEAASYVDR